MPENRNAEIIKTYNGYIVYYGEGCSLYETYVKFEDAIAGVKNYLDNSVIIRKNE